MVGGVGPLAAVFIVSRALYGKKVGEEVFKPLLRWRVGILWYMVVVLGSVVIMFASMGLKGEMGQGVERNTVPYVAQIGRAHV